MTLPPEPAPRDECLMILARYPEPGQAKTRLIPTLGAEGAAQLYRQLAAHTVAQARALQTRRRVAIALWYTGSEVAPMRHWLGADLSYHAQPQGGLGDRLSTAFETAFREGYGAAIAIGTDCPDLDVDALAQAFQQLQTQELVLGPARDGGYYLIGLRQPQPALFQSISWSTAAVLEQTLAKAAQLGLSPALLPTLTDIDTSEDLDLWERIQQTWPT